MAAEYLLHDGIDDDFPDHHLRYGAPHLSSLMMASDDLEIPLINQNDSQLHLHNNNANNNRGHNHHNHHHPHHHPGPPTMSDWCAFGQKGFRPRHSDYTSNKKAKQQLIVATLICFLFMIAELVGGLMAGSLAVVTDAAHLLSDCIGFIVAMVAISLAKKQPDGRMSFGYKRFEVFGAVVSVLGIWLLTGILVYMAVLRVLDQSFKIDADTMIVISTIGVGINIVMASVLHGNCMNIPMPNMHGHSHGGGHGHSHGAGGCGGKATSTVTSQVSDGMMPKKDEAVLANGVINIHSTSIHTTHSRHNSFSKTLPNGGTLLDGAALNEQSHSVPNLYRAASIDKSYTRLNLDHTNNQKNGSYTLLSIGGSNEDNADCGGAESHSEDEDDDDFEIDGGGGGAVAAAEDLKLGHSHGGKKANNNINIRAAMIHVIGDFVQSIGVLISAVIIKFFPEAKLVDPICTFFFSVIVFFTTIRIIKESVLILLDAVPTTINLAKLEKELRCIEGVHAVHYLTVWGVSVDWNVMAVHLVIDNMTSGEEVIRTVARLVKRAYNIKHVTVQVEKLKSNKLLARGPSPAAHHHHIQSGGNELI